MKFTIIFIFHSVLSISILVDCRSNKVRDDRQQISSSSEELTRPDYCSLNADVGPCKMGLSRYFYNPSKQTCEKFIYGGCRGNRNNFRSKRACLAACNN